MAYENTRRRFIQKAFAASLLAKAFPQTKPRSFYRDPLSIQAMASQGRHRKHSMAMMAISSPSLEPYVDAMPIPPSIYLRPNTTTDVYINEFHQKLHRDLPPTRLWGYNSTYPGPT